MSTQLSEIITAANQLWPEASAASWDQVGLIVGEETAEITSVLLAVDASCATVMEAEKAGAQLLLTHHPLLLKPIHTLAKGYKGQVLTRAIRANIALYAAHTNADIQVDGVSDIMAKQLQLQDIKPLSSDENNSQIGIGRIGKLKSAVPLREFATKIAEILPSAAGGIRVSGEADKPITTVALCAGAGDSLLNNPMVQTADVYITSDLRHHPAQEARENNPDTALIDVSHWAAASLWLHCAAKQLQEIFPNLKLLISEIRTDPWDFVIHQ